jgi:hypothetical protein
MQEDGNFHNYRCENLKSYIICDCFEFVMKAMAVLEEWPSSVRYLGV